ncbi:MULTISPECIES: DUF2244 domain-containing protein [unclassified Meridianimarinicoccus]|uniref:DUF2244 domain-containing protein n=1 Tax=unclassified Meridianimarinicoccus TaxID=2923344 RepID=UPI0018677F57|nr:DUF2244 domain-containing protein [Fluviibacterium sp. MJW13]
MPIEWVNETKEAPEISGASFHDRGQTPLAVLHLWPHRSLPKKGFVLFIAITFGLVLLPLLAVIGTPVLWGLLPFVMLALGLMWALLQKNYRDGEILEELTLWSDLVTLTRRARRASDQSWQANPYWVSVHLHDKTGPVEKYLTLKGAGREVELGAFLSSDERADLYLILADLLPRIAASAAPGHRPRT